MRKKLHTLGPIGTDSYSIAKHFIRKYKMDIILHKSFDEIINKLDNFNGEYLLFPVAYRSINGNYDWVDFNFEYCNRLELIEVYAKETKKMVLIENICFKENVTSLHPATKIFWDNYNNLKVNQNIPIVFSNSKIEAFQIFLEYQYRYTIVSEDVLNNNVILDHIKIRDEYCPNMIWCMYKIKEK